MAKTLPTVNVNADTFLNLIDKVNAGLGLLATDVVTVNATANGAATTGNGYVTGILGATTLVATGLRGGNVQSAANLAIQSNVVVTGFLSTTGDLSSGNSTVNSVVNSTAIAIGIVQANTTALRVGANVIASATQVGVGNSTVNSFINSTAAVIGAAVLNTALLAINALAINAASVGNSTVNASINSTSVVIGTTVVNTTTIAVGSNVVIDTNRLSVGNSTVNSFVNSTAGQLGALVANSTAARVGANVIIDTVKGSFGNSTVNAVINSIALIIGETVVNTTVLSVPNSLTIGNSSVNVFANSSAILISGVAVISPDQRTGVVVNSTVTYVRKDLYFANSIATFDVNDDPGNNRIVVTASISANAIPVVGSNTQISYNDSGIGAGSADLTFNKVSKTLGVGNTISTPNLVLQNGIRKTANSVNTTGTSQQTIDTFLLNDFRAMYYTMSIKDNNSNTYVLTTVGVVHNDGAAVVTEFVALGTNNAVFSMGEWEASVNATTAILQFTPVSTSTTIKIDKTGFPA